MRLVIALLVALSLAGPMAGCSGILRANFEHGQYVQGGSADGTIPGSPNGDRIYVAGETISIYENNAALPIITAVYGEKSMSLGFATGIGFEVENGIAYFSSAPIQSTDNQFNYYWSGKKISNASAITCNIGSTDSVVNAKAAFRVSAANNWTVVDAYGSHILGPVVPRPESQDAPLHTVKLEYYPGSGSFTVEIGQLNVAPLTFGGTVFQNTKAEIQNAGRLGMWCLKTSTDSSFLDIAYLLDNVLIREE